MSLHRFRIFKLSFSPPDFLLLVVVAQVKPAIEFLADPYAAASGRESTPAITEIFLRRAAS